MKLLKNIIDSILSNGCFSIDDISRDTGLMRDLIKDAINLLESKGYLKKMVPNSSDVGKKCLHCSSGGFCNADESISYEVTEKGLQYAKMASS